MIKYKNNLFLILIIFAIILGIEALTFAEQRSKSLTIIFSNNINAETDPCPT